MVEWLEEMFGKEALEIENNPDLGCFTLIVESACNEMVNKEEGKGWFYREMPANLQALYDKFFRYMKAFARHAHSG